MSDWIINPEIDMVDILAQYGRFLANDYRMLIEHLEIPKIFEEYTEKTNRRFMIVGSKDTPWILAKSVFLCLKLAGPDSVVVKTPNLDESFMVQNVFDYHSDGVRNKVFVSQTDELKLSSEWRDEIENATDIIVFGNQNAMETFREYETVDRRVWEHGYKFSFGIVHEEHLTPTIINQICFDFFSFYGEGSLAPKFYFLVGKLRRRVLEQFSANMIALYSSLIEEYRDKLPLTRKSELVEKTLLSNYAAKYVRIENLQSEDLFDNLYGDVRLVLVEDLDDVESFINSWIDNINTVAINMEDDENTLDFLEDKMVVRICDVGSMQFPDFFEQYDSVDDFIIYATEEEYEDDITLSQGDDSI
jgi:hypothetical protein